MGACTTRMAQRFVAHRKPNRNLSALPDSVQPPIQTTQERIYPSLPLQQTHTFRRFIKSYMLLRNDGFVVNLEVTRCNRLPWFMRHTFAWLARRLTSGVAVRTFSPSPRLLCDRSSSVMIEAAVPYEEGRLGSVLSSMRIWE